MRYGSLFSGVGGLDMAIEQVFPDATPAWFAEFDPAPSKVLARRWPGVPNLGDVTKVDWASLEPVDLICGGSPCQDVSAAGRRAGMREGTRSNLWVAMREAIAVLRPKIVVWENVRGAASAYAVSDVESEEGLLGESYGPDRPALRALGRVLGDLSDLGFDAEWRGVRAADVGAPHGRFRVFVVAWPADDTDRGRRDSDASFSSSAERVRRDDASGASADPALTLLPTPKAGDADFGLPRTSGRPPERSTHLGTRLHYTDFGIYTPAIVRWERVLGRSAPSPTELSKTGKPQLSPRFVEWMMGWPDGWVTDPAIGLTRAEQLRACGNGVVPQQAAWAVRECLKGKGGNDE